MIIVVTSVFKFLALFRSSRENFSLAYSCGLGFSDSMWPLSTGIANDKVRMQAVHTRRRRPNGRSRTGPPPPPLRLGFAGVKCRQCIFEKIALVDSTPRSHSVFRFNVKIRVSQRGRAKCSRHPHFDPSAEGFDVIRDSCSTCKDIKYLFEAQVALERATRDFVRRATPWEARRKVSGGKAEVADQRLDS
jgi:hypothetical protein